MIAAPKTKKSSRLHPVSFGATPVRNGVYFRVWAPDAERLDVAVATPAGDSLLAPLGCNDDGIYSGWIAGVKVGDRYKFRINGENSFPDPASRFQPEGVHGPSEVVDPSTYRWSDVGWRGIAADQLAIYELHVGAFTPEGDFAAAAEKLPYLRDLGVNTIELMPIADFPGRHNWGYDGVSLFAPARCYGRPNELRRFVDEAHRLGLAVMLDVVYNHLGPDGNYVGCYSKAFHSDRHHTAWGAAHNFDGPRCEVVREFFIQNALQWIRDYHMDGLRLDATHAIEDDSPRYFLEELTERVRAVDPSRHIVVVAEDHRNLAKMVTPVRENGWGIDAVWSDSFHHQVRRMLAGDSEAYYRDFTGTMADLATTIERGWFYCGQYSENLGENVGTDPSGLDYHHFVVCLQNHDQVGNRAFGERLHHQIDPAAYRAASALLLCGPATPLLFMGQEWATTAPFLFFTDHNDELGVLVTKGRRHEFRHFAAFTDPQMLRAIPDPQANTTFADSRLGWKELTLPAHAAVHRLYRDLLLLRRTEPALRSSSREHLTVRALDEGTIVMGRLAGERPVLVVVRLLGEGAVKLGAFLADRGLPLTGWSTVLTTEDAEYALDPNPPEILASADDLEIRFPRPAAVVLRAANRK